MDILEEKGFSIIEALIALVLLGVTAVFCVMIFNGVWSNPSLSLKGEARVYAEVEIENCINSRALNDTTYYNEKKNLIIMRKIDVNNENKIISVTVKLPAQEKEILKLSVVQRNENQ